MPLELVRPDSLSAAAAMLTADARAHVLGGGTLLVRNYTAGDPSIGTLVLPDALKLDLFSIENGHAELGAAVTMAKVASHPGLAFLHDVAHGIGGPALRAMATVGGNLFAPSPYGDFCVALLALGADITIDGEKGSETVDLEAFLKARAAKRSIVSRISFAIPPAKAFRFAKVTRKHPHGASVLSIAALLPLAGGKVKGARVAYGAMAPTPIRGRAVEKALESRALDDASIDAAVAVAGEGTSPASDPHASAWYRANVLPVHLKRLLKR